MNKLSSAFDDSGCVGIAPAPEGHRTDASGKPVCSIILLSIPDGEFALLRPYLEHLRVGLHQTLHEAGNVFRYAYFLNGGLTSLVIVTRDGKSVEISIFGKEGVLGAPLAVQVERTPYHAVVQIESDALRVPADVLRQHLPSLPGLSMRLNRYAHIQGMQMAQLAACNRLHEIEQRLARWLLMSQDRLDSGVLPITHDILAQMLGTGRPSVSIAAGMLQKAGMIEYSRGEVKILNRKSLEEAACECYGVLQNLNGELGLK